MERKEVSLVFSGGFNGELIAPNGTCRIGVENDTLAPYDLLFGALASCLYSTFLDVAEKKRINFDRVEMIVTGEKRDAIPALLKWVNVKAVVFNAEKELGLEQSFKLATEYCSIYETISKVAEMSYEIHFEYEK